MRVLGITILLGAACARTPSPQLPAAASAVVPVAVASDTVQRARDAGVAQANLIIAGRETEPAEAVFMNIVIGRGMPSGRFPAMMNSMAQSLGVTCSHCHVPGNWSSDEKPAKVTARQMFAMMRTLNAETLPRVLGRAPSAAPLVTCATCHRGSRRPAISLMP